MRDKADLSDFMTSVSDQPKALFAATEEQVPKGAAPRTRAASWKAKKGLSATKKIAA
jgi:hypothetical protein